ncbi:MAG: DUF87 domain-containing protein [Elusimicrobia bacterium]|nr:DUF87 domain-containing protein [Elusimicrobiota bacterium]
MSKLAELLSPAPSDQCLLHRHLNLLDITPDGLALGMGGEISAAYELSPHQDILLMNDAGQARFIDEAALALESLPAGAAAVFVVDVRPGSITEIKRLERLAHELPKEQAAIVKSKHELFSRSARKERKTHLLLGLYNGNFLKLPLFPRLVMDPGQASRDAGRKLAEFRDRFVGMESVVLGRLSGLKASHRRLDEHELADFYWQRLNPDKAGAGLRPPKYNLRFSHRCQLAASAGSHGKTAFAVDGVFHQAFSLFMLDETVPAGGIDRMIAHLPEGSTIVITVLSPDHQDFLARLDSDIRGYSSLMSVGAGNHQLNHKIRDLDELAGLGHGSGTKFYIASLFVLLRDHDQGVLANKALEIMMAARETLGGELVTEDFLHLRYFLAQLPNGAILPMRRHTLTANAAACLLPLSAPWKGAEGPGVLFYSKEQNMVNLDPFWEGSPRHGMVIGSTGSGKSFTMNYVVSSLLVQDPKTNFVVIDMGGSYKRLTGILGGDYFEIEPSGNCAISPFPPKEAMIGVDGAPDADLLGCLRLLIQKMLIRPVDQIEKHLIETGITRLYQSANVHAPLLGDFVDTMAALGLEDADCGPARHIANELRLYTKGGYGNILNAPSTIRPFEKRLTVFDLARLKQHPELQAPLIFMISLGLSKTLKDPGQKKVVIIDEGWEFFDDDASSELVSRLYRTARKFNGLIISVSQSPKDFIKSKASTAMIANSFWKMFLRLDMGHDTLGAFGLNSRQIEAVRRLETRRRSFAELFVVFGEHSRTLRLNPSSLEYWIATTNAEDCAVEERLKSQKGAMNRLDFLSELALMEPVEV